ncbi:hypothetical protein A7Q10_10765 [Methylacidiphilum caldifontis]|uniref:Uncharacterized protein n=1 Tax=Methylacidiphilum caldifontis TaxID=2795386 RepID=A0A4Y8PH07_9BACT|nr:hypothetical protein A7Q10_10765 [Methylacidiphilum caldifontis]
MDPGSIRLNVVALKPPPKVSDGPEELGEGRVDGAPVAVWAETDWPMRDRKKLAGVPVHRREREL